MAITVKIPEGNNPFICHVGGKKYIYLAGSTQSVPEAVAAVIANVNSARQPKRVYTPAETVDSKLTKKADKLEVPADSYILQSDANGNTENSGVSSASIPVVISTEATESEVGEGIIALSVDASKAIVTIISFNVIASTGAVRVVTNAAISENTLSLTVTSLGVGDIATAYVTQTIAV